MDIIGYLKRQGKRFYPFTHTKAVYDNNGIVLEDRLKQMDKDSKAYTDTKVADLVGSAPETLDTIEEVANAIETNQGVVDALNSAIGNKANKSDVESALNNKANKTDVATAMEGKLDTNGDSSDTTVVFDEGSVRENINSGEDQSTLWSKAKKWFSDLKTVAFTGSYNDLSNTPTIPTKTSQLVNDSGYKTTDTTYREATASQSGLMSPSDKSKLDGIAVGANNYTHPSTHSASMIAQDNTHRFVTEDEKETWNNMLYTFSSNGYIGIGDVTIDLKDMKESGLASPTTITIGCEDSRHWWLTDYTCSGTDDQTIINQAIAALPENGGKIVLLEGTYNINGQINISKSNVVIEGMGREATILQTSGSHNIFNITASNCKICSMTIKQSNNSKPNGIGAIVVISGSHAIIRDVEASGFAYGISAGGADMVIDSLYSHDNNYGIYSGNGNGGTNFRKIISNCIIKNNNVGIGIEGSYNHIFGNNIIDNGNGIWLVNYGTPNNNQIQGNYIIRGTGQASDYTASQYTIQVQSPAKNNDFSNNYILGKNYVNGGGSTNTFVNNRYE